MSFPKMSEAFSGWVNSVTLRIVRKDQVDFEQQETLYNDLSFFGVIEPIPPRKLMIKPEGERSWNWLTLYTRQRLTNNDIIQDAQNRQYRVMSTTDWRGSNYLEYELTEQPITVAQ